MSSTDIELIGDVGKLKGQVEALTSIAGKLDIIIDKLVDQHDRHIAKVYTDMENRRLETEKDIKEIHERIDTVLDKMQSTEKSLSEKIDSLRDCITTHNKEEQKQLESILQWKWMIAGGILVLSWLLSHVSPDTIVKLLK
jgi:flagellar motility protein MotE (MotC chaperone)